MLSEQPRTNSAPLQLYETHLQSFVGVCAAQILLDESSGIFKHDCLLLTTAKPAATLSSPRGVYLSDYDGPRMRPDCQAEVIRRDNAEGRSKAKIVFLADLSGESADLLKRSLSRLPPVDSPFAR